MREAFKRIFAIFVIVSVFCGIGCKGAVDIKPIEKYGTIEGKAFYSNENVDNHSGIQITLVSTDGLMATDFCSSRGISTNARSVKDIKTTVKDGSYSFNNIPEGVYTVYASSNSTVEKAVTTNISVNANQIVTAEDLKLTATGAVRGNITIDGSTAGTLGLDVFIAGTSFDGKVGSDGSFELTGIPAKKGYVLCVQKGDYTSIIDSYLEIKANSSVKIQTVNLYSSNWEEDTAVQENPTFKWLGAFANAPKNPKLYEAYFNTEDGCSYIWNGNSWDLLAQAGKNGTDGVDGEDGKDGKDGLSIVWKGSLESAPENPELYWVYYNIEDGCSYIWNGSSWDIISQDGFDGTDGLDGINGTDGKNGVDGLSIIWKGVYSVAPENPELNWSYYNTEDGCSYIWNGREWDLLAHAGKDGKDGLSITWKGSLEAAPENPELNWAYYNINTGCSYIWNGSSWDLLSKAGQNGTDGKDGLAGADGMSIIWQGSLREAPKNPELNWAYYNTTDGCSYIWNGSDWDLLAKSGEDGVDGEDGKDGTNGKNGEDGKDGVNGTDGKDGVDGQSIVWKGALAAAPENPELNWAYYNINIGCSYIWNGSDWDLLTQHANHTFNEWTVVTAPTCETEGKEERACAVCLYKEEKSIQIIDHSYVEYVSNNDATFDNDGTKTRECSVCGYKDTVTDEGSKIIVPEGFVLVEGTTITGTESWSPESDVFVS